MKRVIAVLAIIGAFVASASALSLSDFETAFKGFNGDMAESLAVNSTIGNNWSDAYVGGFPHLGVGATIGASTVSLDSMTDLISKMGIEVPAELSQIGFPLPTATASFKIGLPFIPVDIGVKGMYLPVDLGQQLEDATGVVASYENIGIQARFALVKQNLLLPNISIGAAYNIQQGSIETGLGVASQSITLPTDQGTTTITAGAPKLGLAWESSSFDFTAQISKQLLILVPYVGAGYTIGTSTVTSGVTSAITTDYVGGVSALNTFLQSIGGPTITDQGFVYTATADTPVLRVYGGCSLRLLILDLDVQGIYLVDTGALGASVTARVQL